MQQSAPSESVATLVQELTDLVARLRAEYDMDPFGNPILSAAQSITRRLDAQNVDIETVAGVIASLRDAAFDDRAKRIAAYVGGVDLAANRKAMQDLAARLVRPDPADSPVPLASFRAATERTRFAAVFTAHPTFSLPAPVEAALANAASGREAERFASHRPNRITLEDEFVRATDAMKHGRDALDQLSEAILSAARATWPGRWSDMVPRPVILTSWVGYDTDGRNDIFWWDTLRLRLRMKHMQLDRLHGQIEGVAAASALAARIALARDEVEAQLAMCPNSPDADKVAAFARHVVHGADTALTSTKPLMPLFQGAIDAALPDDQMKLAIARAGLVGHGLSLAHTHVRLNSTQLHNVARQRLGLEDQPEDISKRRGMLVAINAALEAQQKVPVDFGALLGEQASAARLMMTVAQIVKHVDSSQKVRFLIAETETGYTLLCALWLARLFGIEQHIEISPLFETADALEGGGRVLEEALRSPHYRAYLSLTGRMALQFGYSDSGRYVGQIAATYLIEKLRLKVVDALSRHGLEHVEVVLFDTHGESVGRGAHPGSLSARLSYLSPPQARAAFAARDINVREESAFQGGDGYMLFGTPELALATVARIADFAYPSGDPPEDPIYEEPDFAADFFGTARGEMQLLVEDPGYAALLGAFGPALLDPTGSRPAARQVDGMGGPAQIKHPRELRAIPNNAILQQLGWMANSVHGLGAGATRNPPMFADMLEASPRFRMALSLAGHALAHSDIDVLRAIVATFDPGIWLDRAAHARRPGRREQLVAVSKSLERLGLGAQVQAMFRRIQADHVALRAAWPTAPTMRLRAMLLHALRLTLIHRIWLLETAIPDFSPRHGVTRAALGLRILRLDIPQAVELLHEVFPLAPDPAADQDYGEPAGPRANAAYAREHAEILEPMLRLFGLVREISTAISHEVGAFG
jgi:phosphoenolpyruvate carboxylase